MNFLIKDEVHSVKDVNADDFIQHYSKYLKNKEKMEMPIWADYVKTGIGRERAPDNPDWLYIRAASIMRHLCIRPNKGVNSFRTLYGNKQRRGTAPGHHSKASGSVIRYCLKQLEKKGLIQVTDKGGRRLTKLGEKGITAVAKQLYTKKKVEIPTMENDELK